jgi:hypothetical protein
MIFDALSVAAILVSVSMLILMFWFTRRNRQQLETRLGEISRQSLLLQQERTARDLCAAIYRLYPTARPGLDYVIDCEAHGKRAYIKEWRLTARKPTQAEIDKAIEALSAELK